MPRTLVLRPILLGASLVALVAGVTAPATFAGTRLSATPVADSRARTDQVSGKFVPSSGVLFGAAVARRPGQSRQAAVTALEGKAHRRFDLHRLYDLWDDRQPESLTSWTAADGRIPIVSIKARRHSGAVVGWSRIASGAEDTQIRAQADGLKRLDRPVLLAFHHEPENDPQNGSASAYRAAFRHFVAVYRQRGVTNVAFTWIVMADAFDRHAAVADAWYPGDDVVDWIGADGYNWYGTRRGKRWRSFADTFVGLHEFGAAHRKPVLAAEFASLEDHASPGRKAAWLQDATRTVTSWGNVKAVSYFHSPIRYPWWVDSSASSTAAFARMGAQLRAVR